nr:MAG TPA: hypothetical protein [Caudoviricetes sp.]
MSTITTAFQIWKALFVIHFSKSIFTHTVKPCCEITSNT